MNPPLVRYHNLVMDSARWEGFTFREDDIVISTPSKCGTTWTQMICALLIFQTPDLPLPVDQLSPWVDMLTEKAEVVRAQLDDQEHRRFIKTHTPLDGLPFDPRVTYIAVARDPRDVAVSWAHHADNMDMKALLAFRSSAVGLADIEGLLQAGFPTPPKSEADRFWEWIEGEGEGYGLPQMIHHLDTFWQARSEPNIMLLHYGDLKADLEGQMRAIAARLAIEVPERLWPQLVEAASFTSMKARAVDRAPATTNSIWRDTAKFFYSGTNGQWEGMIDATGMQRYEERLRLLAEPGLVSWIHQGQIAHSAVRSQ